MGIKINIWQSIQSTRPSRLSPYKTILAGGMCFCAEIPLIHNHIYYIVSISAKQMYFRTDVLYLYLQQNSFKLTRYETGYPVYHDDKAIAV